MEFIKPFDDSYKEAVSNMFTNPGNEFEPIYHRKYALDGTHVIEVLGQTNIKEKINSCKDQCDIKKMIKQYSLSGDPSFLGGSAGQYCDISGIPNNFIDAYNMLQSVKETFAKLPLDVRNKYGSDLGLFLADLQYGLDHPAPATSESEVTVDAVE